MILNEAMNINKTQDLKGNPIAFIDPNSPDNKNTFEYRQIFKDYGAEWSQSPKFRNVFPQHKTGFWFWYIGKTEEQWNNSFNKRIKPALEKVHELEGVPSEDSRESIIASLNSLIGTVQSASVPEDSSLTDVDKNKIAEKIKQFKERLVNIKDDEEFKTTVQKLMLFRSAQGHQFSFGNTILTMIQNPDAKVVKSRSNWVRYNRIVNQNARPILLFKPGKAGLIPYSKETKDSIIRSFLQRVGKRSVEELGPGESEKLSVLLSGRFNGRDFDLYEAFDVADTTLMEGKEDLIKNALEPDLEWNIDNMTDDRVKPIYTALKEFAESKGIQITMSDAEAMGGAKGYSSGGRINVINNEGNDVGITVTLAHEIAHELLHQTYAQEKNPELRDYFVGKSEGHDVVEQQAELTAWMVMSSFGFDVKTTSLNYITIWGGNPDNMVKVFDTVSKTANLLIGVIMKSGGELNEVDIPLNVKHYTPEDVAEILGVEQEYQKVLNNVEMNEMMKESLLENFYRLCGIIK